jgi:hypothetical protein
MIDELGCLKTWNKTCSSAFKALKIKKITNFALYVFIIYTISDYESKLSPALLYIYAGGK